MRCPQSKLGFCWGSNVYMALKTSMLTAACLPMFDINSCRTFCLSTIATMNMFLPITPPEKWDDNENSPIFHSRYIFKWLCFHCHVRFRAGYSLLRFRKTRFNQYCWTNGGCRTGWRLRDRHHQKSCSELSWIIIISIYIYPSCSFIRKLMIFGGT